MAGIPIVEVVSGGIPAVDTPNGAPVTVGTSGLPVTWVTSGGIPLNKGGGSPPPAFAPETTALLARMTVQPDATRQGHINTLIVSLKSSTAWSRLNMLYVLAAHDAQAALLNWISTSFNLSPIASPTFTVDRGYNGDGSSSFLDTNANFATFGGTYTQNDAHAGVWALTGGAVPAADCGTTNLQINTRSSADNREARLNASAAATQITADGAGHLVASRLNATEIRMTWDGSTTVLASASVPITSASTAILRRTGGAFSTRQLAAAHFGSGLTDAEAAAVRSALQTYLQAVGAI